MCVFVYACVWCVYVRICVCFRAGACALSACLSIAAVCVIVSLQIQRYGGESVLDIRGSVSTGVRANDDDDDDDDDEDDDHDHDHDHDDDHDDDDHHHDDDGGGGAGVGACDHKSLRACAASTCPFL